MSSRKGAAWEREFSKILSRWWSKGERDDIFWRTSGSGGRATRRRQNGLDTVYQSGDITFTDPSGKPFCQLFHVELKKGYGNWDLLDIIDSRQKHTQIEKFWRQTVRDCPKGRIPVLVFCRQHRKPCIAFELSTMVRINRHSDKPFSKSYIIARFGIVRGIYIMKLDNFLKHVTPDNIRYMADAIRQKEDY